MSNIYKFFTNPALQKVFKEYEENTTKLGAGKSETQLPQAKNCETGKSTQAKSGAGQINPQAIPYELAERMAIMGENCEPDQVKPYITTFGVLVIPHNSDKKYHYWNGGQSICATLKELGRCDLIEKYTHPDYFGRASN